MAFPCSPEIRADALTSGAVCTRERCARVLIAFNAAHTPATSQDMVQKGCVQAAISALPPADYPDNPSPFLGLIFALAKSARA